MVNVSTMFPLPNRIMNHSESQFYTAQKMKISIKDFFSKCDQIRRKLQIWSHLLKKSIMENFNFCAVLVSANDTRKYMNEKNVLVNKKVL